MNGSRGGGRRDRNLGPAGGAGGEVGSITALFSPLRLASIRNPRSPAGGATRSPPRGGGAGGGFSSGSRARNASSRARPLELDLHPRVPLRTQPAARAPRQAEDEGAEADPCTRWMVSRSRASIASAIMRELAAGPGPVRGKARRMRAAAAAGAPPAGPARSTTELRTEPPRSSRQEATDDLRLRSEGRSALASLRPDPHPPAGLEEAEEMRRYVAGVADRLGLAVQGTAPATSWSSARSPGARGRR